MSACAVFGCLGLAVERLVYLNPNCAWGYLDVCPRHLEHLAGGMGP